MTTISATLFIESEDQTLESLAVKIGVPPSSGWSKGELHRRTGRAYGTNSWKQEEKATIEDDPEAFVIALERVIATVLDRLMGHECEFREVAKRSISGLVLGISSRDVPPLILNAELLGRIAALGISCEIDLTLC